MLSPVAFYKGFSKQVCLDLQLSKMDTAHVDVIKWEGGGVRGECSLGSVETYPQCLVSKTKMLENMRCGHEDHEKQDINKLTPGGRKHWCEFSSGSFPPLLTSHRAKQQPHLTTS